MVWLYVSVPADSSIAFELDKTMTGVGGGEEGGGGDGSENGSATRPGSCDRGGDFPRGKINYLTGSRLTCAMRTPYRTSI